MFVHGRYVGPFFQSDPPPGGEPKKPDPANPDPPKASLREQLTEEQRKELDSQMAATRRQAEADAKARLEADALTKKQEQDAEAERKRQQAAGEFDQVRVSLETERDSWKTKAEQAEDRSKRAIALLETGVEDQVKLLKERDPELAKAFPGDADVLDKIEWLNDPRTKRVLEPDPAVAQFRQPRTPDPQTPRTEGEQTKERSKQLAQSGAYTPL